MWRAVDQDGYVRDQIVQTRRTPKSAKQRPSRLLQEPRINGGRLQS